MKFEDYGDLISYIQSFHTKEGRLQAIIEYFIDNVKYDYVMVEYNNNIVTPQFIRYIDRLFPCTSKDSRDKAICYLRNCSNISNEYWHRIKNIYFTPINNHYFTLEQTFQQITPDILCKNELLYQGTCQYIVEFANKLCKEAGIESLIVEGFTCEKTAHCWLNICINGLELFYDIVYAIFSRDNFCGMGRYSVEDWLGIDAKSLYKNQPTRTIVQPQGFNLKTLALTNSTLTMHEANTI